MLNKQIKLNPDGTIKSRGIGWCSHTHNGFWGCKHDCTWEMPEGDNAACYAGGIAERFGGQFARRFDDPIFRPEILDELLRLQEPARIFEGSMADVFGHWNRREHINQLLDTCRLAYWHTILFLTKNAPRLKEFDFPSNCHVGVSAPPSAMNGVKLTRAQQDRWFHTAVSNLINCNARVKWVSFEPLSYDIARSMRADGWNTLLEHLDWAVIGAASNGPTIYQPEPAWVYDLVETLDAHDIKIFYKSNLKGNPATSTWREEFPAVAQ